MDRDYIRDNQVIERYVQKKLTPEERDAFEQRYLVDPELQKEIALAKRMLEGFKDQPQSK